MAMRIKGHRRKIKGGRTVYVRSFVRKGKRKNPGRGWVLDRQKKSKEEWEK